MSEEKEYTHGQKMKGHRKKADFLSYCLEIGFKKNELDELEKSWDNFKNEDGSMRDKPLNPIPNVKELQSELKLKDSRIRDLEEALKVGRELSVEYYAKNQHLEKLELRYESESKRLIAKISDLEDQNKALAETVAKLQILRGELETEVKTIHEEWSKSRAIQLEDRNSIIKSNQEWAVICAVKSQKINTLEADNQTLREENESLKTQLLELGETDG